MALDFSTFTTTKKTILIILVSGIVALGIIGAFIPESRTYVSTAIGAIATTIQGIF